MTLHHSYNCNYNYTNYTTLQLQLHYTTTTAALHPAVVGEVTTATIATTPKTQLQPAFGSSVDSLCHPCITTTHLSYRFPIFETSATALCGTTGIKVFIGIWRESFEIQFWAIFKIYFSKQSNQIWFIPHLPGEGC